MKGTWLEPRPKPNERKTMITLWIEPSLVDEADAVAAKHFKGVRAELIRAGVREIIHRLQSEQDAGKAAAA